MALRIGLCSIFVDDQAKALAFYTEKLGFVKKQDFPVGEARFLTVVSPAGAQGVELLLEPNGNPVAKAYQRGLLEQGIPATAFLADDVRQEHERLTALGVKFMQPPADQGPTVTAIFNDTCGNLILIAQQ